MRKFLLMVSGEPKNINIFSCFNNVSIVHLIFVIGCSYFAYMHKIYEVTFIIPFLWWQVGWILSYNRFFKYNLKEESIHASPKDIIIGTKLLFNKKERNNDISEGVKLFPSVLFGILSFILIALGFKYSFIFYLLGCLIALLIGWKTSIYYKE